LRRLISWLPPLGYMAVIFVLSSQPNPLPAVTSRVSDKLLHFVEYGGLAALFVRALTRDGVGWRAAVLAAIVMASGYGATDEYHQAFVPNRNSDVRDWVTDTVGGAIGALAYARSRRSTSAPTA
jgi:VanZ family protein